MYYNSFVYCVIYGQIIALNVSVLQKYMHMEISHDIPRENTSHFPLNIILIPLLLFTFITTYWIKVKDSYIAGQLFIKMTAFGFHYKLQKIAT